jgi:hypothetical protein
MAFKHAVHRALAAFGGVAQTVDAQALSQGPASAHAHAFRVDRLVDAPASCSPWQHERQPARDPTVAHVEVSGVLVSAATPVSPPLASSPVATLLS